MPFRRSPDVVSETIDGQALLVSADGSELLTLNRVGTRIWELLEQHDEPEGIARALSREFEDVSRDALDADISEFIASLLEQGLVEVAGA